MTHEGVRLAARFSLATNRRNYCGPTGASAFFLKAIRDGSHVDAAGDALLRFEALAPYLRVIGAKHGLDPLDESVVEAYWIGNDLLDAFTREDYAGILQAFESRGMPRPMVDRMIDRLPGRPIPHHMFHVAFVGVGAVTGKVPTNLENMERCRPGWGRVLSTEGSDFIVEREPLVLANGRLALGPPSITRVTWDAEILPDVSTGDWIATHWDLAVLRLSPDRRGRLQRYTREALEAARAAYATLAIP